MASLSGGCQAGCIRARPLGRGDSCRAGSQRRDLGEVLPRRRACPRPAASPLASAARRRRRGDRRTRLVGSIGQRQAAVGELGLDVGQRGRADVLDGPQLLLGPPGQVAERLDAVLAQAAPGPAAQVEHVDRQRLVGCAAGAGAPSVGGRAAAVVAGRGTAGGCGAAGWRRLAAGSAASMAARLSAKMPMSLPPTSARTPRPNWAGLPVTFSVVCTMTSVWSPSAFSSDRTEADAVPAPRVSLPDASRVDDVGRRDHAR